MDKEGHLISIHSCSLVGNNIYDLCKVDKTRSAQLTSVVPAIVRPHRQHLLLQLYRVQRDAHVQRNITCAT